MANTHQTPPPKLPPPWSHRLFRRWWREKTVEQQDRFATIGPLVSVLLFLAAIILAFWYLRNEEFEREQESVRRDTEIAQQQIRLRLIENQEQLVRIARDVVTRSMSPADFMTQASNFSRDRPEVAQLIWLSHNRNIRAGFTSNAFPRDESPDNPSLPREDKTSAAESAFQTAKTLRQPVYSTHLVNEQGQSVVQIHIPLMERRGFAGVLVAEYSLDSLIRYFVPTEVSNRHAIALLDADNKVLTSTAPLTPAGRRNKPDSIAYEVPLAPANNGLYLRGLGYRTSIGLISNTLFWMVMALSALTLWMLLGTWRHMRRRSQMQSELVKEANFRRAMENSMLTGMRAMDMAGRITYVNPAFCAMTGFSEDQLLGKRPPYPHWPPDYIEENIRILEQELQGRSPHSGIEVKVMRKDGSLFDSRMYMSPLIDPKGLQTGWMTSMTNITEAKRVRDQLTASHERFTTVLEGLDAAVSVVSVHQGELLFANRFYRRLFGGLANGHTVLAGGTLLAAPAPSQIDDSVDTLGGLPTQELTESTPDSREVHVEEQQKWFDVRTRYVQWTDGRLAQMLIATDITSRLVAEAQAATQAEKAQVSSRLITMGEMASSVAHELNQPLTAIANYCNGIVSRVNANAITQEELIAALQKTSRQAERAGQIIHRIRAFVKRSEPQRQSTQAKTMVEEAMELAGIELRRRQVSIRSFVAERLPSLMVDPILIEQVLLNLIKNAAEAIDSAQMPPKRRHIELRVALSHNDEEGSIVEFSISDMGPGLKNEVIGRLYEAFFSTKAEGMGIGLSLCRSIIESHRGRIKARNLYNDSEVVGCCFSFSLPVEAER